MTASRTPRTDALCAYLEKYKCTTEQRLSCLTSHLYAIESELTALKAAGDALPEEPVRYLVALVDQDLPHDEKVVRAMDYAKLRAVAAAAMAQARELSEQVKEFHDAVGALTDAEDVLSCIPEGPERDELQRVYNGSDPDDISMPFSGSIERKI